MRETERRVLVVDDERNTREALKRAVTPLGIVVDAADSGDQAVTMLAQQSYDLVLVDLRMPGMSGLELLRHLANAERTVPAAVLTGHGTVANAVEAMKLGAIDFLQKPFSLEQIRTFVQDILQRAEIPRHDADSYEELVAVARHAITHREFESAREHLARAIGLDPSRPDGFVVLGMLEEIRGDRLLGQKYYRTALGLDPGCRAASENLDRSTAAPDERRGPQLGP
jgi:DNA-binding NtrC family response regulator